MLKSIKSHLSELKKDIIYVLDMEKKDIDDIEPMRRDREIKIAPVAISGSRGSPRMRFKRR